MKNKSKELLTIFRGMLEHLSSDKETAREYLTERGYDTDRVVSNGIYFINRIKTELRAKSTRQKFDLHKENIRMQATEMAKKLMADPSFTIQQFGRQEQFSFNFRNLESLSKEELQNIIEDYFFLKLSSQME